MDWTLIVPLLILALLLAVLVIGKAIAMPMASDLPGYPGTPLEHDGMYADDDAVQSMVASIHAELDRIDGNGSTYPYDQDLEKYGS